MNIDKTLLSRCILLIGIVATTYASSFSGVFVFDDYPAIVDNEQISEFPTLSDFFRNGRGLVGLTFVANYKLGGFNPWSYHLVNLGVHLISCCTLFSLMRWAFVRILSSRDLGEGNQDTSSMAQNAAWWIAVLWGVHPLTTEAVTFVVQRYESMAVMFILLSLRAWAALMEGKRGALGAVAVFSWGAILSKEMAISLLLLILAWDYYFRSEWAFRGTRHDSPSEKSATSLDRLRVFFAIRLFGYLLVVLPYCWRLPLLMGWYAHSRSLPSTTGATMTIDGIGPIEYLLTQSTVILHYWKLVLFPLDLCLDYGWPLERRLWLIVLCVSIHVILIAAGGLLYWRRYPIGLWIIMLYVSLAPRSSFMPSPDMVFEHRMHLPLVFCITIIVLMLASFVRTPKYGPLCLVSVGLVALFLLALRTHLRNLDYHSEVKLWSSNFLLTPNNPRVANSLGRSIAEKGDWDAAAPYLKKAVELHPCQPLFLINFGDLLREMGKYNEAIAVWTKSMEFDSGNGSPYQRRGYVYALQGKEDLSEADYRKAVELNDAEATYNLALLLFERGKFEESLQLCERLLQRKKVSEKAHSLKMRVLSRRSNSSPL